MEQQAQFELFKKNQYRAALKGKQNKNSERKK
jgi:hypothetical protein